MAYKKIIIKCTNRQEFRRILDKYHGNEEVKQSDLIDYIKTLTQCNYIRKIEEEETFEVNSEVIAIERHFRTLYWKEYTLKLTFE
jgi:hypothetical protein